MNEGQTERTAENLQNNNYSKEGNICSMLHDFYNKNMLSVIVLVWFWAIIFIGGAVYCGIQFFKADQTRDQIMYAVIFVCCWQGITIHRNAIARQIKRLELRIAERDQTTKGK
jgi:hypothetical protein